MALDVFRQGYPRGRREKALPWAWPVATQDRPQWHMVNYEAYVEEGFNQNAWVYSAIMFKVRATITAPLKAYSGDENNPVPLRAENPLAKLVARPNPQQSWAEFQSLNTVYLNLDGNSYSYKLYSPLGMQLYPLRPDRVYIVPTAGRKASLSHYLYVPEGKPLEEGIPLLPEDIIHVKLPNPGDPLEGMGYGLSPLSAASQSADVDNMVTSFLNTFFGRGTMMAGVLSFDLPLTEAQVDTVKARWEQKYGGHEKWGSIGVLDRSAKYQRLGLTFQEMGFEELDARNETRILGPFGVPPILVGAKVGLDRSTYSNYEGARKAVWEDTLVPELMLFQVEYQYHLKGRNSFVKFDFKNVPALQKDIPVLAEAAYTFWSMGVPANQAIQAVGLNLGDIPGGDIPHYPTGRGQGQGSSSDADDDSWGQRVLKILEAIESDNGRVHAKDRLLSSGV